MKRWYLEVKVSVGNTTFWHELMRLDQLARMSDHYMLETVKRRVAVNLAETDVWRVRVETSEIVYATGEHR